MAKGGTGKGRTKEQIALYHEIVRLMDMLNKRSAEAATVSAKLVEAQARLPEILKQLAEQANQAGRGVRNLGRGQRESAADTKTFLQSLMAFELSLRRIQSGLNGLKKTALFAEKTQKDVLQFVQLARSINASAEAMKSLDQAGRKFGLGFGEASGHIKNMKANLADLRWGGSGGGIGKLMERWGGNFTGYESEKEMLTKLREVYMRVRPEDRIMVSKDIGASDAMQDFLTSDQFKTTADFEKYLDEHKIKSLKDAEDAARKAVAEQGNKQNSEENMNISKMENLGGLTNETNRILSEIYKFIGDNPWLTATKLGIDAAGSLVNVAMGGIGIANLLKLSKLTTVAAGATTAAGAASTAAGATTAAGAASTAAGASALPAILVIAASLAVIAGGWYAVKAIGEHYQKVGTGKKEGESDAEFEKRVAEERKAYVEERAQQRQRMVENAASRGSLDDFDKDTQEHLKEFDADVATSRATIKKNNDLIAKQQAVIDRLKKHEIVPDSELAILSQLTGNQALNKTITDQLGGTRDLGVIKQNALAGATTASKPDDFLAQQLSKYVQSKKLSDLTDVFKTENVGKLDNKQWEMFGQYIKSALSSEERMRMRSFVEDAPVGYAVPSNIRNKSSEITQDNTGHGFWWKFFHGGASAQDGGMQILDAIEKEKEHDNGAKILQEIVDYSKKPTAEREVQRNRDMIEGLRRAQDAMKESARSLQSGCINSPYLDNVEAASNAMRGDLAKVSAASDIADEAQAAGGVVNNNNSTVTNNNNVDAPVNVHNDIHVTQNVSADNAGRSLESVKKQADTWTGMYRPNPALKDYAEACNAFFTPISK
jgi:hypothetical protein